VTAIVPYLCYARKDRRTKPNDPVTTRYIAAMFESVGTDAIVALEVHNPAAFENAFRCRSVSLTGTPLFVDYLKKLADQDSSRGSRLRRPLSRSVAGARGRFGCGRHRVAPQATAQQQNAGRASMKPAYAVRHPTAVWILLGLAAGATVLCAGPVSGQEPSPHREMGHPAVIFDDWTAATMAPDGSWGIATETTAGGALGEAIGNCRRMSQGKIGCGAQARVIRAGWIIGLRCGDRNIMAAERTLAEAEQAAGQHAAELRRSYAPGLPPCRPILAVGPAGTVADAAQLAARSRAFTD
jgi:hypothetical protein